jgi:hypothetical protein
LLEQFIAEHRDVAAFRNECRLLEPVFDGAMIVYVIDPSRPVQEAARAEMEILRWTGQPRIALINPIEHAQYEQAWRSELRQHFQQIRVFNAYLTEFQQRIELLKGLGEIDDEIKPNLEKVVDALIRRRADQQQRSARCVAETIEQMLLARERKRLRADADIERYKEPLKEALLGRVREIERDCQGRIRRIYRLQKLMIEQQEITDAQLGADLFSKQTWTRFGLSRAQLATAGLATGAAAGGAIDVSVGGASFFLGAALGGLAGGVASWYGVNRLMRVEVLKQPLGGIALSVRLTHPNFPWVVLDRLTAYHVLIANHPHARRGTLTLEPTRMQSLAQHLPKHTRKSMQKCFDAMNGAGSADEACEELAELIDEGWQSQLSARC